jgi:small subunit ribosomal protein S17
MPPMSLLGVVTKAGFMNKTATVVVSRWAIDTKTGKVRRRRRQHIIRLPPSTTQLCRLVARGQF